jgi:hypothetical protein
MKTILCLTDETEPRIAMLQDTLPGTVTVREIEAKPGCNCDRWGHPCPDCVQRNVQPDAELPISTRAK